MGVVTKTAAAPIGSVYALAHATVPPGFLECDGTAISRTTYANLFAVLSTTYGTGDGSTTFNLPDFRGRFLQGLTASTDANDIGNNSRPIGTAQADSMQGFKITDASINGTGGLAANVGGVVESWAANSTDRLPASDGTNDAPRTGKKTRPANYAVKWIIKT